MATNSAAQSPGRSNKRAFIIAALFGLIAAVLALSFLRRAGNDDSAASSEQVAAVVATRDIPERTVIKENMIEVKQVPVDARHNLAFDDKTLVVGQVVRVPIAAGEQVLKNKVAGGVQSVGFSSNIPQGKRGVAVGVSEIVATGALLGIGDYVDVIGIFEIHDPNFKNPVCEGCQSSPRRYITATVLQNVQVLAVAQASDLTIQEKAGGSPKNNNVSRAKDLKSVTLAVTPEQAEQLWQAEALGELKLSLRPFGDDEQRKIAPIFNDVGQAPIVAVGG
jgi:pilus assembly protein CpaB